jgi:oxygen-independent coproporphyrinogen-3 oxidase
LRVRGTRVATEAHRSPEGWLRAVETSGTGETPRTILSDRDQALEFILMGLRLAEGIDVARCERLIGGAIDKVAVDELLQLGLIAVGKGRIKATAEGRLLLNALIARLTRFL